MTANRTRQSRRSSALSPLALIALAGTALATQAAHAAVLTWASPVSGTAGTAANWSPAQIPQAADDLTFNVGAGTQAYAVTFASTTLTSRTMVFNEDTISLTMSSPHTTTNGITIASIAADVATVSLTTGTWTSSFNSGVAFDIGDVAGATGTLNVNDDDADLLLTGSSSRLRVGVGGTGTLNITNVGRVEIGNGVIVGSNGGSSGTLLVSGGLASPPFGRSALVTTNAAGLSHFGSSGACTATISSGGLVDIASDLFIGQASASVATTTVGGVGGLFRATLDVAGDLFVGSNDTATVAGTGTLSVNSGGDVFVGGTLHAGDDANGGSGTVNINTGALVQATNVVDGALGGINHAGGTLRINGGTYIGAPAPLTVTGVAANDVTLVFANNASQTLIPSGGVSLIVGNGPGGGAFEGFLNIETGADLSMGNGDLIIGDDTGTTGLVTIDGVGSRLIATQAGVVVGVGNEGTGNLEVRAGGQLLCHRLSVPMFGNGIGFVDCNGSNSNITTQFLTVGTDAGTGSGFVEIQPGATLAVTDPGFSASVNASGSLFIGPSATFTTPGTIRVGPGGEMTVAGDVFGAAIVDVHGTLRGGVMLGTPSVDAPVRLRPGGTLEVLIDDLTVGDATSASGFFGDLGSVITIGAHTLTMHDADFARVDIVTIAGGTLVAPNSVTIADNGSLEGTGTITARELFFNSGGSVITSTGTNGITINGRLRNNSGSIDGTKYTFNANGPTSGWSGAGAINARVVFNTDTFVTCQANMSMGLNVPDGVTFNANTTVRMRTDNALTLIDSNGCGAPTLLEMDGGILTSTNGLVVNTGRTLRGRGSIEVTNLVGSGLTIAGGTIDPADFFDITETYHGIGRFIVNGRYTQSSGTYLCEVAGYDNEFVPLNDKITCGLAVLNGTLTVSVIDGYAPQARDRFTILAASSVTGTFATLNLPPHFAVEYFPTRVDLVVLCDGDVNCDFALDGFDVETMEKAVGGDMTDFCQDDPDFNGDFALDGFDVEAVEIMVGGGECP